MTAITDTPQHDSKISKEELKYIVESLHVTDQKKNVKVPWRHVLSRLKLQLGKGRISVCVALFSHGCYDPVFWTVCRLVHSLWHTHCNASKKVFNCGGFIAQTVFMLGAAFWQTPVWNDVLFNYGRGPRSFAWAGFRGFSNTFGTIPGIISPIITGYIVKDEYRADEWKVVFYISSGIYICGAIVYGLFASGERQSWAIDVEPSNIILKNSSAKKEAV
ncbi:hypothetical protein NQ317_016090 [Molorchus minor]|uniref:Uncharacterized protein n=1 Tax=Molorchus minor TaxID=1323400 RepID=A0ABQ9IXF1_9CUCU|nr:hypothetical protein NQ317_016090 [Molorchus minor]